MIIKINKELKIHDVLAKVIGKSRMLISFTGTEELYEKALPIFRKATLKVGTKLNELKSKVVFVDNFTNMFFMEKDEIARQFASTLPLCDYAFDKYMIKKAGYTDKEIHVFKICGLT